jgi:hypothetical protein
VSFELLQTICGFLTLAVIATTVIPAVLQIRHLSSNNQIQSLLTLEDEFRADDMQQAFRYVQQDLAAKLDDPHYREELARLGFVDREAHPEMQVCNWFEQIGTFVKNGMVAETAFFELFGRLVDRYWDLLAPAIAIMRRRRGPQQYQNFEYLTARYRLWAAKHPEGSYPANTARLKVEDPWAGEEV